MMRKCKGFWANVALIFAIIFSVISICSFLPAGTFDSLAAATGDAPEKIVLRVCNWEEYIDLGEWDEDELIELESLDIIGEKAMYDDFCDWYYETYGIEVVVEYSCFGTNEELYNMLTIGDEYDLVCPSDYMIMKLMSEDMLVPFSNEFFDEDVEENYYIKGVSPYIRNVFDTYEINGSNWSKYAAGYMWGVTGILYNPDEVTREEASTWTIINNPDLYRQITVKDNVRDTMFAAMGAVKRDLLMSEEFLSAPDYAEQLYNEMNDVSPETVALLQDYLQKTKDNVYSFETDSGKADMITGKVLANYQWSGDAVYAMDQAEEDDFYLEFAVPEECTDLWFDGWVMLKCGVEGDKSKQHAAEAFINYVSMPENAVRNMYYIGYTSVISGGDSNVVYEYLEYNYGSEEDDAVEYPIGYFFSGDYDDEDYILIADEEQLRRQLYAQYPPRDVIDRSSIMGFFDADANARVNRMWINVRCYDVHRVPVWGWIIGIAILGFVVFSTIRTRIKNRR